MIETRRLISAYEKARDELLAERCAEGHWVGELSSSALSTATAVSALCGIEMGGCDERDGGLRFSTLVADGLRWLADRQNDDGGWGDTDKSYSNIATTMLVVAAFHLAAEEKQHADLLGRADGYVQRKGRIGGLRARYGRDKTFAIPILTNCAIAGIVPWREVSPLPFEAACIPQRWYRFARMPVVSYAIPALVAIGQARYFHKKPLNPLARLIRKAAVGRSLKVLERMQPESGGYLEAIPLTSFVVMALASTGRADHPVTERGIEFLRATVRADGSWPIDTNLATWNTTLAINALAASGEDVRQFDCVEWLLGCQYREIHPYTGAAPGGWGWSDLTGAVPDADDTPGALLALAHFFKSNRSSTEDKSRIRRAATAGVNWLLDLQNRDGGWPTFCRGWGKLPFDRSGADLTAHVLRALRVWRPEIVEADARRLDRGVERGFAYLQREQRADGSWIPLWFGNQDHAEEENPVYGTAKVLPAFAGPGERDTPAVQRGLNWLAEHQQADGGWGSVEETALAVEALLLYPDCEAAQLAGQKGLEWLVTAVEENRHQDCAPIGFYFAKLWYYEKLYPLIFTVSALGCAVEKHTARPQSDAKPPAARLTSA